MQPRRSFFAAEDSDAGDLEVFGGVVRHVTNTPASHAKTGGAGTLFVDVEDRSNERATEAATWRRSAFHCDAEGSSVSSEE